MGRFRHCSPSDQATMLSVRIIAPTNSKQQAFTDYSVDVPNLHAGLVKRLQVGPKHLAGLFYVLETNKIRLGLVALI